MQRTVHGQQYIVLVHNARLSIIIEMSDILFFSQSASQPAPYMMRVTSYDWAHTPPKTFELCGAVRCNVFVCVREYVCNFLQFIFI